jgi:predicted ATPase with chaperone activity
MSGDILVYVSYLNLSGRVYYHIKYVEIGYTIADLARSEEIQSAHLAKALQIDRK